MKENHKWVRRRHGYKWKAVLLSVLFMAVYKAWDILSLGESGAGRRGKQWKHATRHFGGKVMRTSGAQQEEAIMDARLHLVDVKIPPSALSPGREGYPGVTGIFCEVNWNLQRQNPSSVGMFRDLVSKSHKCKGSKVTVKLEDVVEKARAFDLQSKGVYSLPPKAFVFHETRCGSTLVANLLAGFDPPSNRVYSESPPPVAALKACEGQSASTCDKSKAAKILRDVVYLMGRTNDVMEQNLFFKIQSVGGRSISVFREAFPTTPWLFVFRDSIEVMMSHFKNGLKKRSVCLRSWSRPMPVLINLVKKKGFEMSSLRPAQFCAAHLASLCETAIAEREKSGTGQFINYASLPDVMWESILPDYLGIDVDDTVIDNIKKTAELYSKGGRGDKADQQWEEDSERKQAKAPAEVKEATRLFMDSAFEKMKAFSQEGR